MTRGTHVGRAGALYPPAHCTRTSLAPPPPYTHPQANADWSLFCPNEAPGLADCWGEEFEALYSKYEREGRPRKVIKAQQLWFAIMEAQVETGNPFMLYKDSANRKSNQQNLGTIKSSNLCTGAPRLHGFMPSSPPQFPCQSHRSHNGGLWSFSLAVACRHGAACCFVSAFNRTRPLAPRSPLAL
jgi:hypothetical protein